jgi:glycosyltransferase involved in cell wall biosynthesis
VLDQVDALTVHTPEEGDSVRADFGSRLTPYWQVPIGRDAPSRDGSEPAMEPGYVLSVGRIEPLKNQLALIEALRPLGARLVLVGRENTRHPGYVRRVRAAIAASGNVVHLPFTPKPGLDALYRRASMHVIASWCEVFPLTTVEAAANGCRVVTTRNSYEAGIYGASVPYVNPRDIAAMRDTLARAVQDPQSGRPEGVTTRIHSWRAVAERLLEVYRSIAP